MVELVERVKSPTSEEAIPPLYYKQISRSDSSFFIPADDVSAQLFSPGVAAAEKQQQESSKTETR
jgi:hypothetical protein